MPVRCVLSVAVASFASFTQMALAAAVISGDSDARDECMAQFEMMIADDIPETSIHALLLEKARLLISRKSVASSDAAGSAMSR